MRIDVIVVGAGPAGCSAAYHASRAGLEVLLLDQHESRQDQADGDALFSRAVAEVSLTAALTGLRGRTTTSTGAPWCTPARPACAERTHP